MLETKVILLQITNAVVTTKSSISGPNSVGIVNGKEYVEFGIRPTEEASEFYKEYWIVGTELYLYLDGDEEVYIYNDDLENFRDFIVEYKIKENKNGKINID